MAWQQIILHILVVSEMTFINLYTMNFCSVKKRSELAIWTVYILFSAVLFGGAMYLLMQLPYFGTGNGLFVLFGMLYIFPMLFAYRQPLKYTVTVACSVWIYTMMVFTVSLHAAYLMPKQWFLPSVLIIQSVIYLFHLPHFLRFMKEKFLYIIKNISPESANALLRLCLSWFISSVLLNFVMVIDSPQILRLVVTLLLAGIAVQCFRLFYSTVSADNNAKTLQKNIRIDALTRLKNRVSFYEDIDALIHSDAPFSLFFIDLDHFKDINDRYGHLEGDKCLVRFAQTMEKRFSGEGTLYRVSGDEFVFLFQGKDAPEFYHRLISQKIPLSEAGGTCIGYSAGTAAFPEDGTSVNALIAAADKRMYRNKQKSHRGQ